MKNKGWLNKNSRQLFKAMTMIDSEEVMANFCRDLMTESEIEALSGRWQAAQLLNKGVPQREVSEETGVSIATVTRVNKWLERGMNGYKQVLEMFESVSGRDNHHSHTKAD